MRRGRGVGEEKRKLKKTKRNNSFSTLSHSLSHQQKTAVRRSLLVPALWFLFSFSLSLSRFFFVLLTVLTSGLSLAGERELERERASLEKTRRRTSNGGIGWSIFKKLQGEWFRCCSLRSARAAAFCAPPDLNPSAIETCSHS